MSKGVSQYEKCSAEIRMMSRARKLQKFMMRVEWRGQRCVAPRVS